jgi:fumarate hydratase class I
LPTKVGSLGVRPAPGTALYAAPPALPWPKLLSRFPRLTYRLTYPLKRSALMTVIKQDDLIQSVADALQFISYYHPVDFIQAMHEAYLREESPAARDSMAQILINSRMCATGHRPICQDTGIVTVFVRVGMDVRWDGATMSLDDMINEGVRRAYNLPENVLRASILADPAGARKNTKDNTPAVIHYSIVPGNTVEVDVAAKGGGSENKSKMAMLNPSDSIVDWVLKTVPTMGAGWCPPGMLGIGIGGTAEKAAVMAKEVLMESIDIHELKSVARRTASKNCAWSCSRRSTSWASAPRAWAA